MDKNFNRKDFLRRIYAVVIFITIMLLYNTVRLNYVHQKEEQIQKEKEIAEIRRKERIINESVNAAISLEETEAREGHEISVVTDKLSNVETTVEETVVEETEEYKPRVNVQKLREHRSSVYSYSYVYPGTKKSPSKTRKRQDYIENLAEEYMDAEGLDYDSAYEAAEED